MSDLPCRLFPRDQAKHHRHDRWYERIKFTL